MSAKITDAVEPKTHFIETELEKVHDSYIQEFNKGANANHELMCQLALRVVALLMRRSNRYDTAHSEQLTINAELHMHEVKNTYNSWAPFIVTIISSVMSVAGGGLALAGAFTSVATKATLDGFKGFAEAGSKGLDGFSGILNNSSSAQRTVHEYKLREVQRRRDDRENTIRQGDTRTKDSMRDSKEVASALHNAAQDMLR